MERFNNGIIFTNDNCKGCNKCVNTCVSAGANVSIMKEDFSKVGVTNKCISCGVCLDHCSHNARSYKDDTQTFLQDLESGYKISLIVSPAFYITYGKQANQILGYLKTLGVYKIYDAGFGAEISIWLNAKFIRENLKNNIHSPQFFSNTCPSMVNYCETLHPELLENIIPIHTPELCTAIYIRKYLKDDSRLAFLSPCITAKQEFIDYKSDVDVEYNVTFLHLLKSLNVANLSIFNAESDLKSVSFGNLYISAGGFVNSLRSFVPNHLLLTHYESINKYTNYYFEKAHEMVEKNTNPALVSICGCNYGCFTGAGTQRETIDFCRIFGGLQTILNDLNRNYPLFTNPDDNFRILENSFKNLNPQDFHCNFKLKFKQAATIPISVIDEICAKLHKNTPEKRHIDCGYCGYSSCANFIDGVAKGYTKIENCIRYMNDEMQYRISHDEQTGLLNNYSFNKKLEELRKKNPNTEFAIVSADIDKLQLINNLYSYEVGNTAIKVVANTLSDFIGNEGLCSRTSAGLFMLAFPNTIENLERLYETESCDLTEFGVSYPVSIRFGIYLMAPEEKNLFQAANNAVLAMNNITDRVHNAFAMFNRRLYNEIFLESTITSQIKEAQKKDEFQIYFQPQYSHSTKTLVGAETLSRWIKKNGEILSPSSFIPIFEKNGFILDFDHIVWEKTFSTVREWLDRGMDLVPISVNISRVSMDNDDTINYISKLQKQYNVPQNYIHLEITESAVMNDQIKLIHRIASLKKLGFKIAMDDFGSGYSSLNTLKDFPIDILKLDMGFLRGKDNKNRGGNIVSSVMRMANMLELNTIAEGVETSEQAAFLSSLGCDTIQGYLYSKPIPKEDFEHLLQSKTKAEIPTLHKLRSFVNIDNFFNTESVETAFFEHYAGPACITESMNGHLSFLRMNSKLLQLTGYDQDHLDLFKTRFYSHISIPHARAIRAAIAKACKTDEIVPVVCEYHKEKDEPSVWIKANIQRIAINGEQTIFYVLCDDITDQIK